MKEAQTKPAVFKANNLNAMKSLILPFAIGVLSLVFLLLDNIWFYWIGEVVLSLFFLQTFILLHECGHLNYFKSKSLNQFFGHLFGFLSGIPFYTWQHMHNLHHRWTGWRDKDPTTEETVSPSKSKFKNGVVNIAWRLFIPLFYISYKISNYWNLIKIKRFIQPSKFNNAVVHVFVYLIVYSILWLLFGSFIWSYILPAFLLSLIWKELVIMTQHTHIDIPISKGKEVNPISFADQVQYTRSFYLNRFVSKHVLLNFNLHEAHHAFPGIPAYLLDQVQLGLPQKPSYLSWIIKAKSMNGVDYVFKTSKQTGIKL